MDGKLLWRRIIPSLVCIDLFCFCRVLKTMILTHVFVLFFLLNLYRDCVDVASELIKCIQAQFPDAPDDKLRETVQDNLRVCFLRCPKGGCNYSDGASLGLHSKHFIIDDVCTYIGSQNLYTCDLAEWGVVIDSPEAVGDIKEQYWDPLWKVSYDKDDCDVDKVMDGLGIDRAAISRLTMTKYELEQAKAAMQANLHQYWNDHESDSEQSDAEDEHEESRELK